MRGNNPKLLPGMSCVRGHPIKEMSELYIDQKRNTTRCRYCQKYDNSMKFQSKKSLMGKGECLYGHPITSPSDLVKVGAKSFCKVCKLEKGRYTLRSWIHFMCGHQTSFDPPLPRKDDILWCCGCREYRVVERRGDVWTSRFSQDEGALEGALQHDPL